MVASVYRETGLPSVQVLLDPFDILPGPLISLAVTHKVVIFKTGRMRSIAISRINLLVPRMRNCHELVSEAEVQMTLI